jgi:hypothetical protein
MEETGLSDQSAVAKATDASSAALCHYFIVFVCVVREE